MKPQSQAHGLSCRFVYRLNKLRLLASCTYIKPQQYLATTYIKPQQYFGIWKQFPKPCF